MNEEYEFYIEGYKLIRTSYACPEQYDVYDEETDEKIGYLRLRHGIFRAEYLNEIVYETFPEGDGIFEEEERMKFLSTAITAIDAERKKDIIEPCRVLSKK